MATVSFAALEWQAAPLPGSDAPAQLARLPGAADGAFRAFVRFPAGWSRPGAGHYPVAEEFFVLEGDLRLNGITWREGGYAWIPANRVRSASRSESGCLAFAWFAAAPRWIPGEPGQAALSDDVRFAHWRDVPEHTIAGGGHGRQLRAGPEHQTWIVQGRQVAQLAASGMRCETLGLSDRAWRPEAGDESPQDPSGTVYARLWRAPENETR